jgi:hypothetical protein
VLKKHACKSKKSYLKNKKREKDPREEEDKEEENKRRRRRQRRSFGLIFTTNQSHTNHTFLIYSRSGVKTLFEHTHTRNKKESALLLTCG